MTPDFSDNEYVVSCRLCIFIFAYFYICDITNNNTTSECLCSCYYVYAVAIPFLRQSHNLDCDKMTH